VWCYPSLVVVRWESQTRGESVRVVINTDLEIVLYMDERDILLWGHGRLTHMPAPLSFTFRAVAVIVIVDVAFVVLEDVADPRQPLVDDVCPCCPRGYRL
jgi:hypothetical protein